MEEHGWNFAELGLTEGQQDEDLRPEPPDIAPILACSASWALPQEKVLVRLRPAFEQPPKPRPRPPPSMATELRGRPLPFVLKLVEAVHTFVARARSGVVDWGAVGGGLCPPLSAEEAQQLWRAAAYGEAQADFTRKRIMDVGGPPGREALLAAEAAEPWELEEPSDIEASIEEQAEATRRQQQGQQESDESEEGGEEAMEVEVMEAMEKPRGGGGRSGGGGGSRGRGRGRVGGGRGRWLPVLSPAPPAVSTARGGSVQRSWAMQQ